MINNDYKITNLTAKAQLYGLHPSEDGIEFIGVYETQEVLWIQNGKANYFKDLSKGAYQICQHGYLNSKKALQQLSALNLSIERQVELFIYHMYGAVDATPDIKNGELQPAENFRHSKNCPSLSWDCKDITIDGSPLTTRELKMVDLILEDLPDKAIAADFGITESTLAFHKKKLFLKANVSGRSGLIIKAINQNI